MSMYSRPADFVPLLSRLVPPRCIGLSPNASSSRPPSSTLLSLWSVGRLSAIPTVPALALCESTCAGWQR